MHWGAMAFVFVLAVEKSANATASKAPHRVAIGMASRKDHAGISLSPHPSVHRLTPLPRRAATILPLARSGGAARRALQRYIYRIFRGLMPWSVPGMPKRLTTSSGNCFLSLVNAVFTPLLSFSVFANLIHINAAFCCWVSTLCDMIATMIKKSSRQSGYCASAPLR